MSPRGLISEIGATTDGPIMRMQLVAWYCTNGEGGTSCWKRTRNGGEEIVCMWEWNGNPPPLRGPWFRLVKYQRIDRVYCG